MRSKGNSAARGERLTRPDPALLPDPLELLAREHFLHRQFCADLDAFADVGRTEKEPAEQLLHHQSVFLPVHFAMEEAHFFPLLRKRAAPEDDIEKILGKLEAEHAASRTRSEAITAVLARLVVCGSEMTLEERELLRRHTAAERRYVILENAIVLPLARVRLSRGDKAKLHRLMRQCHSDPPSR